MLKSLLTNNMVYSQQLIALHYITNLQYEPQQ